jgi:uncharacterized protein YjbI with pentapeptide repeats
VLRQRRHDDSKLSFMVKYIRKHWVVAIIIALVIAAKVFIFAESLINGTGFNGYYTTSTTSIISGSPPTITRTETYQPGETLWDWLQLLIVPVVLVIGGFWLNQIQTRREQRTTQQQAELDKLSELLLHEKLRDSKPEDEVRNVARARTLTVLPRLDSNRKGTIVQFLFESNLIPVISLSGADLSKANLAEAELLHANLSGANLKEAYLNFSNLHGANLIDAELIGTHLIETTLTEADLSEAFLCGADLERADLSGASLNGAHLNEVEVRGKYQKKEDEFTALTYWYLRLEYYPDEANLGGANLEEAKLREVDLSGANLHGANLTKADLTNADLSDADLSWANLTETILNGTIITKEQMSIVKSLQGATMPNGSIQP